MVIIVLKDQYVSLSVVIDNIFISNINTCQVLQCLQCYNLVIWINKHEVYDRNVVLFISFNLQQIEQ